MGLNSLLGAAVLGCVLAAAGCSRPTQFVLGDKIAMDSYTLSVSFLEVTQTRPPAQDLIVHFRCQGVDSRDAAARFFDSFSPRMRVVDSSGDEYAAIPSTQAAYRGRPLQDPQATRKLFSREGQSDFTEWVATARVPAESHGFSFLVRNPNRRSGQVAAAVIPLGR